MEEATVQPAVNTLRDHVLRTVLYYDIFHYPLKAEEVHRFLQTRDASAQDVANTLRALVDAGRLHRFGEFFCMQNNAALVARRLRGNELADRYVTIARRQAKRIARFPFVRAVLASGSLSKGYMDESSDLDFFIITKPGRLWIARMLLVLYKRVFLLNSHKLFCVNYFVDSDHLQIEDRNLFTATELATVLPLEGCDLYQRLLQQNTWLQTFFPHFKARTTRKQPVQTYVMKKMLENVIDILGGQWLETYCMKLTGNRWKKIYARQYEQKDFTVAFRTEKHASKNHPRHFQKRVIDQYRERLSEFNLGV